MSFWSKLVTFLFPEPRRPSYMEELEVILQAEETKKPKRAKTAKGKFKADDKSTPNVNEAWEGGVSPKSKTRTKKVKNEKLP